MKICRCNVSSLLVPAASTANTAVLRVGSGCIFTPLTSALNAAQRGDKRGNR